MKASPPAIRPNDPARWVRTSGAQAEVVMFKGIKFLAPGGKDTAKANPPPENGRDKKNTVDSAPQQPGRADGDSRAGVGMGWMHEPHPGLGAATKKEGEVPSTHQRQEGDLSVALSRELNPYARPGVPSNQWTCAANAAVASQPAAPGDGGPKMVAGDGGLSWHLKRLQRAVEAAQDTGKSFEVVAAERFGSPQMAEEMRAFASGLHPGQKRVRMYAHKQASRAREHAMRTAADGPDAGARPKRTGPPAAPSLPPTPANAFANDGSFLVRALEAEAKNESVEPDKRGTPAQRRAAEGHTPAPPRSKGPASHEGEPLRSDGPQHAPPPRAPDMPALPRERQLAVPTSAVGFLIGKAGATINAIRRESGAQIVVADKPSDSEGADGFSVDERLVSIAGPPEAVARAVHLIKERLDAGADAGRQSTGRGRGGQRNREETVPSFDSTGQLVVTTRKVPRDDEDDNDDGGRNRRRKPGRKKGGTSSDRGGTGGLQGLAGAVRGERTLHIGDRLRGLGATEGSDEEDVAALVGLEKAGTLTTMDDVMADAIRRNKRFKGWDADEEYEDAVDESAGMTEVARGRRAKAHRPDKSPAISLDKGSSVLAQRAEARVARVQPLIVAMGSCVYLRVPEGAPIHPLHCCLEPIDQETSMTTASDEVATEVRNFQKCIIQLYASKGMHACFLELALGLDQKRRHMCIEAIPLSEGDASTAPAYFRKAIMEAGEEWAQHKKLIDTSGKGVRRCVPDNFAYFHVQFGLDRGFAHVVEDEVRQMPALVRCGDAHALRCPSMRRRHFPRTLVATCSRASSKRRRLAFPCDRDAAQTRMSSSRPWRTSPPSTKPLTGPRC